MKTLNEISKLYIETDIVKLDTGGCNNCFDCCIDVDVLLTPYDIFEMKKALGVDFNNLLEKNITLISNNKIMLPYLKMKNNKECSFLDSNKRCIIHKNRPNICRMYPLGRAYTNDDFKYFLQKNCSKKNLKEKKILDWLEIKDYDKNKKFLLDWHFFIKALTFRLKFIYDDEEIKNVNNILIDNFYKFEYDEFYQDFYENLKNTKNTLGII
jgi:Fe-S-cluster containining protein